MRSGSIWGVAFFLTAAGPLFAQAPSPPPAPGNYPAEVVIVVPEVEVRSGPSSKLYPTSKLRQGERVLVLRESKAQPGWLEIRPPAGSFSWVKAKSVKQVNQIGIVPEEVAVMPGSSIVSQPPNVESVKVAAGTQLVILDRPHQAEGETWLPIQPPPTEVRYIPADAIRPPATPVAVAPTDGGFPTNVGTNNNLIIQGDNALRSGNADLARQLYKQAYDTAPSGEDKRFAQNRIASLTGGAAGQSWQPNIPGQPPPLVPAQTTSATSGASQWSTWGKLRKASFEKNGQPVYLLENKQGQPLLYAIAQSGTSLREYTGRLVCLYGPITYGINDYPRVQYMVASHVALP